MTGVESNCTGESVWKTVIAVPKMRHGMMNKSGFIKSIWSKDMKQLSEEGAYQAFGSSCKYEENK